MLYTLQALSEDDRKLWMDVMDGKEPVSEDSQQHAVCSFLIHYLQTAILFSYSSSRVPTCNLDISLFLLKPNIFCLFHLLTRSSGKHYFNNFSTLFNNAKSTTVGMYH
jgi:hypothetical protein